ncbi:MAG: hypothetical protein KDC44_12225 [Phaeodactylibacter sp.]|nr:hypothetical protein [Phaeodactylibacter sp.]
MSISNKNGLLLVFLGIFTILSACTFDQLEPIDASPECLEANPTYESDIKPIVDNTCAYSGCHVSGFGFGDFSSYEGMLSRLENGAIEQQTIFTDEMPPKNAIGPNELTTEEKELLQCWIQLQYPEK